MTNQNFIIQTLEEQKKKFLTNLLIIRLKPTSDPVHDLRVAVKEIRSFLRLIQKITSAIWKDHFVFVKLFYNILGKYRDFDMSLSLYKNYNKGKMISLPTFKEYLQINIGFTRKTAKEAAGNFDDKKFIALIDITCNLILHFKNQELSNKLKETADEILKEVNELANNFEKEAHEIRKLLKDLYYWLKNCPPAFNPRIIELNVLKQILDELGNWQDLFIFKKKLSYFRKEYLIKGSKEFEKAKTFEKTVLNDQRESLDKAKEVFNKLLSNEKGDLNSRPCY